MTTSSSATRRIVVRGTLLAFAATGLAAALYLIATTTPTRTSFYPKCMFYQTTGLHCPGCGTGRALHFALNGEFLRAAGFNILTTLLLPVILFFVARKLLDWVSDRPPRQGVGSRWIWALFVVMVVFWICRNIPAYPFTFLAPVELP
jgi:hypothetical protein